jgi:hypothetical protein
MVGRVADGKWRAGLRGGDAAYSALPFIRRSPLAIRRA